MAAFPRIHAPSVARLLAQSELSVTGFGHGLQRLPAIQQSAGIYNPGMRERGSPEQALLCTSDPVLLKEALHHYTNQLAVLTHLTQLQALQVIAVHLWKSAVTGTPALDFSNPIPPREDLLRLVTEFCRKINPPYELTPWGMFYAVPGTSESPTLCVN